MLARRLRAFRQIGALSRSFTMDKRPEHLDLTAGQQRSPVKFDATIKKIVRLSPTVKGFAFDVKDRKAATFKSGQWVDFFIPGVEKVGGFSMTSCPRQLSESGELHLAIKASDWPPARWLTQEAAEGDPVQMKVGGDFHYPNGAANSSSGSNTLLVAGGVGINPIFAILQEMAREKSDSKVQLLFSAKSSDELLFKDSIDQICREGGGKFSARYFVTDGTPETRIGREAISECLESFLGGSPPPPSCFVCGPTPMIKAVDALLQDAGVPKERIFYELWW